MMYLFLSFAPNLLSEVQLSKPAIRCYFEHSLEYSFLISVGELTMDFYRLAQVVEAYHLHQFLTLAYHLIPHLCPTAAFRHLLFNLLTILFKN